MTAAVSVSESRPSASDTHERMETHYGLASEYARQGNWGRCDEHIRLGNALRRELEVRRAAQ